MSTIFKKEFSFLDKDRHECTVKAEITTRNGYPEFTMSGDYNGGSGQVFHRVQPLTQSQVKLIQTWEDWYLNGSNKPLPENFQKDLESIIEQIEQEENERKGQPIEFETDKELLAYLDEHTQFSGEELNLCAALVKMLDLSENDLDDININGVTVNVQGTNYLAGTDSEMDEAWDEYLESYIQDCVLAELNERYRKYFDNEAFKEDCRYDGRANSLNRYDGGELECKVEGLDYFAYRQ